MKKWLAKVAKIGFAPVELLDYLDKPRSWPIQIRRAYVLTFPIAAFIQICSMILLLAYLLLLIVLVLSVEFVIWLIKIWQVNSEDGEQ